MAQNINTDTKLILGYWHVGGFATSIRMLLHYLKVDYKNVTFASFPEWSAKKSEYYKTPNTALPNLPHLIDGDYFLTENAAIAFYICAKFNRLDLFGETPQEQGRVRQIESCINDLSKHLDTPMHGPTDEVKKVIEASLEEGKPGRLLLEEIFKVIGDKQFVTGKFSYADLKLLNILSYYREASLNFGVKCPICCNENIMNYLRGIRAMEEFKDFNGGENDLPLIGEQLIKGYKQFPLE